jgi:phospholipase C
MSLKTSCTAAMLLASSTSLFAAVPPSQHVVLLVEENHSYSSVINNPAMPYFNSLAKNYALLTNYYANVHGSLPNYLEMTTGQIETMNDAYTGTISADNVVRELLLMGKTWKSYAESLPSPGYLGLYSGLYVKRHNPLAYFTDVADSSVERHNLVPFTDFSRDLAHGTLPNFSFIAPNLNHDAHNGTLAEADTWLKQNIAPLLNNAEFKKDGILIIVFDESARSDKARGGGHVAALVIGPGVKRGYRSSNFFQHQSVLTTILDAMGTAPDPGAATTALSFNVF